MVSSMISHTFLRSIKRILYSVPLSGSTEVWCLAIRRLTTAFLMMLWQAGTLVSWLFREEPVTGKAASAGRNSSHGMEYTPSNSSSKVVAL